MYVLKTDGTFDTETMKLIQSYYNNKLEQDVKTTQLVDDKTVKNKDNDVVTSSTVASEDEPEPTPSPKKPKTGKKHSSSCKCTGCIYISIQRKLKKKTFKGKKLLKNIIVLILSLIFVYIVSVIVSSMLKNRTNKVSNDYNVDASSPKLALVNQK